MSSFRDLLSVTWQQCDDNVTWRECDVLQWYDSLTPDSFLLLFINFTALLLYDRDCVDWFPVSWFLVIEFLFCLVDPSAESGSYVIRRKKFHQRQSDDDDNDDDDDYDDDDFFNPGKNYFIYSARFYSAEILNSWNNNCSSSLVYDLLLHVCLLSSPFASSTCLSPIVTIR